MVTETIEPASQCKKLKQEKETNTMDKQQTSKDVPLKLFLAGHCNTRRKQCGSEDSSNSLLKQTLFGLARFVENNHNCQAHSWAVTLQSLQDGW